MSKIYLEGFIEIPLLDLELVKSALPLHTKLTLAEVGCIAFEVIQRSDDSCLFDVYEEFINADAFKQHQFRIKGTEWESVTQNVIRHYEIQEII